MSQLTAIQKVAQGRSSKIVASHDPFPHLKHRELKTPAAGEHPYLRKSLNHPQVEIHDRHNSSPEEFNAGPHQRPSPMWLSPAIDTEASCVRELPNPVAPVGDAAPR
jgi:hypothetical protein